MAHTSFDEQQAFLKLPLEQQNLMIYMNGNETNGNVAEALRRIGKLEELTVAHDGRLEGLERWQLKAAAIVGASIIAGPGFFWALAQAWH